MRYRLQIGSQLANWRAALYLLVIAMVAPLDDPLGAVARASQRHRTSARALHRARRDREDDGSLIEASPAPAARDCFIRLQRCDARCHYPLRLLLIVFPLNLLHDDTDGRAREFRISAGCSA